MAKLNDIFKNYKDKIVPIPINNNEDIIAFPTSSPEDENCIWLFPAHIRSITPTEKDDNQLIITFHNGKSITLNKW